MSKIMLKKIFILSFTFLLYSKSTIARTENVENPPQEIPTSSFNDQNSLNTDSYKNSQDPLLGIAQHKEKIDERYKEPCSEINSESTRIKLIVEQK